jgi:hypothetical protein
LTTYKSLLEALRRLYAIYSLSDWFKISVRSLAFERALNVAPGLAAAYRWLASIYRFPGGDAEKAEYHRSKALKIRRKQQERQK